MSNKTNLNCPVSGCRTAAPHLDDPTVKALMSAFAPPSEMTMWTLAAMAELAQSIYRDLEGKQVFAFHTRIRQPEELYIRTLYTLFVATEMNWIYRLDPEKNVIRWAWVKYDEYVERYGAAMHDAAYTQLSFVRLRSRHEVDAFLA